MPEIVVMRDNTGRLVGLGERDNAALVNFRRMLQDAVPGETFVFSYEAPRSPVHHRWLFWRVDVLLGMQEVFIAKKNLMDFLKVGAGLVDFKPGTDGQLVAVPRSIAWHTIDEREFTEARMAIEDFMWTDQAQATLWPHLTPAQRSEMVDAWSRG